MVGDARVGTRVASDVGHQQFLHEARSLCSPASRAPTGNTPLVWLLRLTHAATAASTAAVESLTPVGSPPNCVGVTRKPLPSAELESAACAGLLRPSDEEERVLLASRNRSAAGTDRRNRLSRWLRGAVPSTTAVAQAKITSMVHNSSLAAMLPRMQAVRDRSI
jgi:hypothetical protein